MATCSRGRPGGDVRAGSRSGADRRHRPARSLHSGVPASALERSRPRGDGGRGQRAGRLRRVPCAALQRPSSRPGRGAAVAPRRVSSLVACPRRRLASVHPAGTHPDWPRRAGPLAAGRTRAADRHGHAARAFARHGALLDSGAPGHAALDAGGRLRPRDAQQPGVASRVDHGRRGHALLHRRLERERDAARGRTACGVRLEPATRTGGLGARASAARSATLSLLQLRLVPDLERIPAYPACSSTRVRRPSIPTAS